MKIRIFCDIIVAGALRLAAVAATSAAITANAATVTKGGIILPGPTAQISEYQNEWCAPAVAIQTPASNIKSVCFGRSIFNVQIGNELHARAIVLVDKANIKYLYLETEPPAVELRKLAFEVFGPLSAGSSGDAIETFKEIGRVKLSINSRGEVNGVEISTPRFGYFNVQSQR